jgi:tetratricopeptide (TPR) repeat protein
MLLLPALVAAVAFGAVRDSACARAEYLLFNRHLNRTWLDSAEVLLTRVRQTDPEDEYCLYLLSRVCLQKGDDAKVKSDKMALYIRARNFADSIIALNDQNPEGHMWWGVADGRIGQTRGVLNSLFMIPELKREFNRTLALDPGHPTAYDALGVLYYELPGFAGGSLDKSEQYFKQGLKCDPNYTLIRLDLAKVYIKQKRWLAARTQLEALLATEKPRYPADTELDDKPEARELLEQIKDK